MTEDSTEPMDWNFTERIDCAIDVTKLDMTQYKSPFPSSPEPFSELAKSEFVKVTLCAITFICAVVGNILIILLILVNKHMRIATNFYILNMAVTDMIIACFCLWIHLVKTLYIHSYILGPVVCRIDSFMQMTTLTAGVLTLVAISCDRFVAVMFPLKAHITQRSSGYVISAIWIISCVISSPFIVYQKHHIVNWEDDKKTAVCGDTWPAISYYDETGTCHADHYTKRVYYTICSISMFFFPITVMSLAYITLVWKLWFSRTLGENIPSVRIVQDRSKKKLTEEVILSMKQNKKVIKMVIIVLICFVFCWMPLQILILYSQYGHPLNEQLPKWFKSVEYYAYFVAYANSALNPIIYCGFNANYRQELLHFFRWRRRTPRIYQASKSQQSGQTTKFESQRTKMTTTSNGRTYSSLGAKMHDFDLEELQKVENFI